MARNLWCKAHRAEIGGRHVVIAEQLERRCRTSEGLPEILDLKAAVGFDDERALPVVDPSCRAAAADGIAEPEAAINPGQIGEKQGAGRENTDREEFDVVILVDVGLVFVELYA